jgi:hypothetical protein
MVYDKETFFRELDYPTLPVSLESDVYKCIIPTNCILNFNNWKKYYINPDLKKWLDEILIPKIENYSSIHDCTVQRILKGYAGRPPHTDGYSDILLYYLIDAGGDSVLTNWYIEKNSKLFREPNIKNNISFENFQKIFSVVLPVKKWLLLETNILHNISNLETERIAIAIRLYK